MSADEQYLAYVAMCERRAAMNPQELAEAVAEGQRHLAERFDAAVRRRRRLHD